MAADQGRAPQVHSAELLEQKLAQIRSCRLCRDAPSGQPLPHEPRPVLQVSAQARLLICGQAPGVRVHASGMPFTDPSGDRLRDWLSLGTETFYDCNKVAIVPMGFCFPGLDARKADLPPRKECRITWHDDLFALMPRIETVIVVGSYARAYHFARAGFSDRLRAPLTQSVQNWRDFAQLQPRLFPLPHPSWRNSGWLKRNPWFERDVLPPLRASVARAVSDSFGRLAINEDSN